MLRLRLLFSLLLFCSITLVPRAAAQSTLTQIQDTVYNPDGSLFNGTLVVTWTGTTVSTGSNPTPSNASVRIYNGALSISLIPSTTTATASPYAAAYTSSDGLVTWTENWQVPPASSPLNLSEVRISSATPTGPQISISQVTGLTATLNAINGSLISLSTTANNVSTTVSGLSSAVATLTALVNGMAQGTISTAFSDGESPSGAMNGTNAVFTLANSPSPTAALSLYRNGVLLSNGADYSLNGATVTFVSTQVPQSNDVVQAFYRVAGSGPAPLFIDDQTPQGTVDGANTIFSLSSPPLPLLSLRLYKNGDLLQQNTDYTLSGTTITFASTRVTPQPGDALLAFYRTLGSH